MSFVKNATAALGGLKSFVSKPSLSGFAKLSIGPIAFGDGNANPAKQAVLTQEQQDAAAAASAQTDAAVVANATRVAQKRAYQANALALGGNSDDSLGLPGSSVYGANSVLASGASPQATAAASITTSGVSGGSVLGGGASGGGRTSGPAKPALR